MGQDYRTERINPTIQIVSIFHNANVESQEQNFDLTADADAGKRIQELKTLSSLLFLNPKL